MFENSEWIWPCSRFEKNQRAEFFFSASISELPEQALMQIGCETKYWLFVNGTLAVFDGGLFRESTPGCGYYDEIDIARFLRVGNNDIAVHVNYYGNGGRNNSYCEKPGLILSCDTLSLYSSESVLCQLNPAYVQPEEKQPSFLYGGNHTAFDSRVRPFSLRPEPSPAAVKATVLGTYGAPPWGTCERRPVPQLYFSERIPIEAKKSGILYTASLPHAMQFSPYFKLKGFSGAKITVHSDRYEVNGGPGDFNRYYGHRAEYTCRDGVQEFEMLDWIFGEKILFFIPEGVEIIELGYRESGYDAKVTATFRCDLPEVNLLFEKCVRTLKVCMRENYMDCPDRERGQWIGDVSVQAPQIAYLLDKNGLALLRKAIFDFIRLRKGDVLMGNVPGDNFSELPSQSLNAISELGMIATYYRATGDAEVLRLAFEPSVRYLMLWETDADGVVLPRAGNWEWYDHLFNCDKPILNVCWYYSALRFARTVSDILNVHRFDGFICERMNAIERCFDARYWDAQNGVFTSGGAVDDRANAMAVLSGLCSEDKYPRIRFALMSVFNSTTYMEGYVLSALCEMGYKSDAFARMMCRYQPLIHSENSTLWEDFFHLGTRNHAWSGAPATVLLRYFAGIRDDLSQRDTDIAPLGSLKCSYTDKNNNIILINK